MEQRGICQEITELEVQGGPVRHQGQGLSRTAHGFVHEFGGSGQVLLGFSNVAESLVADGDVLPALRTIGFGLDHCFSAFQPFEDHAAPALHLRRVVLLASAVMPVTRAILDVSGFDTSSDAAFLERVYIPGLRRAGDQGASNTTPS